MRRQADVQHARSDDKDFWMKYTQYLNKRRRELARLIHPDDGQAMTVASEASIRLWQEYVERGVLPFAGGLADQPADIMRDFQVLDLMKEYVEIPHRIANAQRKIKDAN